MTKKIEEDWMHYQAKKSHDPKKGHDHMNHVKEGHEPEKGHDKKSHHP